MDTKMEEMSSYDIKRFYMVALIGGAWPLIWLGRRNGENLGVSASVIGTLSMVMMGIFFLKILAVFGFAANLLPVTRSFIRLFYRGACIFMAGVYCHFMSEPFGRFIDSGGETKTIVYDFTLAFIISIIVEAIFICIALFLGDVYAGL